MAIDYRSADARYAATNATVKSGQSVKVLLGSYAGKIGRVDHLTWDGLVVVILPCGRSFDRRVFSLEALEVK